MAELTIYSRIRKSPFYASTVAAGARSFTVYNAMYMPTSYGDPDAEYECLTQRVSLWDVACERQVEVAGPGASEFAQRVSARDLGGMKVGRARYTPMCDYEGRLINDPVVLRVAKDRFWFSIADSDILLWMRAIAGQLGAEVSVREPDVSPLAIQGPKADDLVRDLFGAEVVEGLGFFHHRPAELDGIPLVLCRSGWSKQGGFELFLTAGVQGNRLWNLVMEAGAPYGIGPGSPNAVERLESGLLSYGSDHDDDTDPVEAGLGSYTSLKSSVDFIGRAALEERMKRQIRRPIVNVVLSGEFEVCEHPWEARVAGAKVGQLRNATWSRKLDSWIGVAQVETPHDAGGAMIELAAPSGQVVVAAVTDEPFGTVRNK